MIDLDGIKERNTWLLARTDSELSLHERDRRDLLAHVDALAARLAAWETAAQQGHPSPCNLGPLCPYCEIDRYKARLAEESRRHMEQTAELVQLSEDRRVRLAEAEALLRIAVANCDMTGYEGAAAWADRRDALLAADSTSGEGEK